MNREVERFAWVRCAAWCGSEAQVSSVRRRRGAWLVEASHDGMCERFVIQPLSGPRVIRDAEQLQRVHRAVARRLPSHCLCSCVDAEPRHRWLVTRAVTGPSLQDVMLRCLRGEVHASTVESHLVRAGNLLRRVAATSAADVGLEPDAVPNRDYEAQVASTWRGALMRSVLHSSDVRNWADDIAARSEFSDRFGSRVLLVDAQPRNLLVSDDGLEAGSYDYAVGNPAMSLAQFLASVDRIGMRGHGSDRDVQAWKRAFTCAFAGHDPVTCRDAAALYPWVALRDLREETRYRPWLLPILARRHERGLRAYLPCLQRLGEASPHVARAA